MRKGYFRIDTVDGQWWPGYTTGELWNGYATPWFTKTTLVQMLESLQLQPVLSGDIVRIRYDPNVPIDLTRRSSFDEFRPKTRKKLYEMSGWTFLERGVHYR